MIRHLGYIKILRASIKNNTNWSHYMYNNGFSTKQRSTYNFRKCIMAFSCSRMTHTNTHTHTCAMTQTSHIFTWIKCKLCPNITFFRLFSIQYGNSQHYFQLNTINSLNSRVSIFLEAKIDKGFNDLNMINRYRNITLNWESFFFCLENRI